MLSRRAARDRRAGHLPGRVPARHPAHRDGRFGVRLRRRPDASLGVLTERDIFGRIVGGDVDLSQPVETLMTTEPRTLDLDQTIRDAIDLMQTGRYRNVPIVDADAAARRRRPPGRTSSSTSPSRSPRSSSTSRRGRTSA